MTAPTHSFDAASSAGIEISWIRFCDGFFGGAAILAAAAVSGARYAVRHFRLGGLAADDWVHMVALLFACLVFILGQERDSIEVSIAGKGLDAPLSGPLIESLQQAFAGLSSAVTNFWTVSIYFSKATYLILYWQIFRVNRSFRWRWWLVSFIWLSCFIIASIIVYLGCDNVTTGCTLATVPNGSIVLAISLTAALSGLVDLMLLLLPLSMLPVLQISQQRRTRVLSLFALSLCATVIDIPAFVLVLFYDDSADANLGFIYASQLLSDLDPPIVVIVSALPALLFVPTKNGTGLGEITVIHGGAPEEDLAGENATPNSGRKYEPHSIGVAVSDDGEIEDLERAIRSC